MTRTVAVTGSSGFIGRNLMTALAARGATIPIARPFDAARIASRIAGADAIVHLGGLVSAPRDRDLFDANVENTRVVADAARRAGVPVVYISSLAAGGPAPLSRPRVEDDPPSPLTPYGHSKLAGERVIRATDGLHWTILRPTVVYGPGDRGMLPLFRLAARGVLPHVGRTTAHYMFVHVHDLVRAIDRAIDARADGETMFVCHP
ncbi:MAG TPA: NAD-dependent epimerase/dehydratase family protein, partial [Vicinamibacterales bacterium]|nr:NAD-dependent epimerase/dehydratase family protein [Vicinamibacterales bacterium]